MKSQKYRITNDKFWKLMIGRRRKFKPGQFYSKGVRYNHRYLNSGYYDNQTWGALHKSWVGFVIAIKKDEPDNIKLYARHIQKLERELDMMQCDFSDWGIK